MAQKQQLPLGADGALPCSYCHKADSDQVRFKPIDMEANCGACHDLAFARDGGTVRTLPHGKPAQVAGIIRDFTLSESFAPRAAVQRLSFDRHLPGKTPPPLPGGNPAARAQAAVVSAAARR